MKTYLSRVISMLVLGAVISLSTALMPSSERPLVDEQVTNSPMRQLLASRSTLTDLYHDWQTRYVAAGGDRRVEIQLSWVRGLSTEPTLRARGRARVDLLAGEVEVVVSGAASGPFDVWLVDNLPGPGRSALPELGDRMVKVGRLLGQGGVLTARHEFGEGFFASFQLDQVVVTRAGQDPSVSRGLLGTRPFFERLYTRTRLAAERRRSASRSVASFDWLSEVLRPRPAHADFNQFFVSKGLVSQIVADGADLFFDETFEGNGRTCGTCHPPENNQTIDVAFIASLPPSDPLFIAELSPAQGGVPGLERPNLLNNFGLILENIDGFSDPTVRHVMRSVPHTLSLATSIVAPLLDDRPQEDRTGWSGDGSPGSGSLRQFSLGAVFQHFPKTLAREVPLDFGMPDEDELDAMEAFMLSVGRLNEISIHPASLILHDQGASNGRDIFRSPTSGKCRFCHIDAGANAPFIVDGQVDDANQNIDTGVEQRSHPAQLTESFLLDGGHGVADFDCNGNGVDDCFGDGSFNVPPLIEAADTAPFFHNNVEQTLEEAVRFYSGVEFNASPGGDFSRGPDGVSISLTETESDEVAAFLRVINAAFNIALADQRADAAAALLKKPFPIPCEQGPSGPINCLDPVAGLLELANAEAQDAVQVLQARQLHPTAVARLNEAISIHQQAIAMTSSGPRRQLVLQAVTKLGQAKASLGSGFDFILGEGNLLF